MYGKHREQRVIERWKRLCRNAGLAWRLRYRKAMYEIPAPRNPTVRVR